MDWVPVRVAQGIDDRRCVMDPKAHISKESKERRQVRTHNLSNVVFHSDFSMTLPSFHPSHSTTLGTKLPLIMDSGVTFK